jgi:glycosyltransferase involved in cell wall biosynthesis
VSEVLLLAPTGVPGGAERALAGLARHLPSHGFPVSAVLLEEGALENWLADIGCPVLVLPRHRTREVHRTVRTIRAIRARAVSRSAGVVLSNQSKGHVYGGLAARGAGLPAVYWQQGIPGHTAVDVVAGRVPATAVVCSSEAAVVAQRRLSPHRQIVKIALGIPLEKVAAAQGSGKQIRLSLGWDSHQLIGIVGRLEPWKGQETFLRSAAIVARDRREARFVVVGGAILGWEGSYPDDLRALAAELGIADRVHFAGHQDDPYAWLDALDVVVHASIGEPFGLVVVEAMALGKPLVAAAEGGPLEIVEDGANGVLVAPGRPEPLAAAVERLLDEPGTAARLGAAARVRAQLFSEERMASSFCDLLRTVVAEHESSSAQCRFPVRHGMGQDG